ncbi:transmembrane protein NRF-6 [Trypanosoma theileri]|uniref:Transmembrane protein NRF-6 n=1 Tax=Trypanosoma theileri TaxID=67003 RepID=A0A1X0P1A8_9TRYP|nr:transmembrane protein NRF-6 [Trypanosoma theileri]ORC90611.1 transmembrane protein NRF-6 [Trypanosoma theileri]
MSAVTTTITSGFCNQTEVMQRASGGLPGILGSYSHCPVNNTVQFCILFPRYSVWGNSRLLGYCLPTQCTLMDIAQHVLADPLLNTTFSYGDLLTSSPIKMKDALAQYIKCASHSSLTFQVHSQNIVSWTILGFIILIVLLATLYDYYRRVTTRIIPFEIVKMGNDGGVVRVLPSPSLTNTVFRSENSRTLISSYDYESFNHYRQQREGEEEEKKQHQQQRKRELSFPPSFFPSISQPLLSTRGDSITDINNNNNNNDTTNDVNYQLNTTSPLETVGKETIVVMGPNSKSYCESSFSQKETRVNISTGRTTTRKNTLDSGVERTTGILPDFNIDVFWSKRRMQQLLVEIPDVPDFHSIVNQIVLCLSLINSFRKWRYYPKSEANLNLFNSWRVLAWMWIMLFSIFWYSQQIPTIENVGSRHSNFLYAFFEKEAFAGFAVSTFLVIAGFLALHRLHTSEEAFLSSPTARVQKRQRRYRQIIQYGFLWYIKYLIARFVRVVPITFCILALLPNLIPNVGSGPFWKLFIDAPAMHVNCVKYWWTNFLLINNILPLDWNERCFPWSYYVALEFQLSALAPIIYILGKHLHHRLFSALLLFAMMTSSVLRYVELTRQKTVSFTFSSISHYSLPIGTVYQYPHLMFIPFCAGAMLYYLYKGVQRRAEMLRMFGSDLLSVIHRIQDGALVEDRLSYWLLEQLRKRRIRILFLWSGLCITLTCILSAWVVHRDEYSGEFIHPGVKVYESLILFPWCIGLCLLALPLLFGYGGMFRRILIHRLWCGPSRLILVAYLVAPLVIGLGNASSYEVMTMSFLLLMVQWFGYTVATLLVAFVFHMLIERPCLHVSSRGEY